MTLDELIDRAKKAQADQKEAQVKDICTFIKSQLKGGFIPTLDAHQYADSTVAEAVNGLNQESTKYKLEAYTDYTGDPIIKIAFHEKSRQV